MKYYRIEDEEKIIGYFCGLLVKKFGFNIMGSPLKGTGTNYMGPIVNEDINLHDLIDAIIKMCKDEKIVYLELSNDILQKDIMEKYDFKVYNNLTHKISIPEDESTALKNMKRTGRNRVKKAISNEIELVELDDKTIALHFIDQLREVYGKQRMALPFKVDRVISLCESSAGNGRVLKYGIKHKDKIIASGLFPYDENAIYFWGAASWSRYQSLLPNEFIHWEVIKFAIKNKIPVYNMCGGGSQFKDKFGGEDVPYLIYSFSFLPLINYFRNVYKKIHWTKLKIKNRLKTE
jgi:hypothetical protein